MNYEEADNLFIYDPETGFVYRRATGLVVGSETSDGYLSVYRLSVYRLGKNYKLHRLAWLLTHKEWPEKFIDHINGNRKDNRIGNLREALNSENLMNCKIYSNNKSGVKGVCWDSKRSKWRVTLTAGKKTTHLGYLESLEDAKELIGLHRKLAHGEFANHGND